MIEPFHFPSPRKFNPARWSTRVAAVAAIAFGTVAGFTFERRNVTTAGEPIHGQRKPIERLGRWSGYGWGDGYHACEASGSRIAADLPPRTYSSTFGSHTKAAKAGCQNCANHGVTFYDRFDAANAGGCDATCDSIGGDDYPAEPYDAYGTSMLSSSPKPSQAQKIARLELPVVAPEQVPEPNLSVPNLSVPNLSGPTLPTSIQPQPQRPSSFVTASAKPRRPDSAKPTGSNGLTVLPIRVRASRTPETITPQHPHDRVVAAAVSVPQRPHRLPKVAVPLPQRIEADWLAQPTTKDQPTTKHQPTEEPPMGERSSFDSPPAVHQNPFVR